MNIKRLSLAIVIAYIVMSILGITTDILLAEHMPQMKALGRMGADLEAHIMWMYLGYFVITIIFCYIYVQKYAGKGWQEGAKYGFLIGLMMAGVTMVLYGTMPMDGKECALSAVATIIIYMAGGISVDLVYKKDA
ncbi:MAG: hypothetical protein JKY45_00355 [Emcibacter sp.]|nr:hypothetical protein [Emcibacter sp.]